MAKGKALLNALTIVGYVFVGLFLLVSVYLGIAYAAGYFNPQKEPIVGLKFSTADTITISENGGKFELKVVDINAVVSTDEAGNTTIEDSTTPAEVRLIVRNSAGLVDNSIISVPQTVMTGDTFTIEALIDETDGYNCNKGGDCYIIAESVDKSFRSQALAVFVDVPVKEIEVSAVSPITGQKIDLDTADFIYGDSIQLVTSVYPKRALNPHNNGVVADNKVVTFTSDEVANAAVGLNSGLVDVTYRDDNAGDTPVLDPQYANITVTIQSVYDSHSAELISPADDCKIRLFPIQLKSIQIQNEDYAAENSIIKTTLHFDNNEPLKFSATDTGVAGVINLDLYLEPTISHEYNTVNPLLEQLSDFYIDVENSFTRGAVSWNADNPPLEFSCDRSTGIWTITALRTQEPDEEITLVFGIGNHTIVTTRSIEIDFSIPENFTFVDGENPITQNEVIDLSITKDGNTLSENADFVVASTYNTAANPTFTKFVYFVDTSSIKNKTGSLIVEVDETTGELVLYQKTDYGSGGATVVGEALKALGAGSIKIRAYVVRTNEEGQPIDCDYNVISDASGIVEYSPTTAITNAPGKYVAYNSTNTYNALNIRVTEKLQQFKIYTSTDFDSENELGNNSEIEIGTQDYNAKTLYAVPNSPLALPTSETYEDWSNVYGSFTFVLHNVVNGGDGELYVPQNEIAFIEDSTSGYARYLSFKVYTKTANEIKKGVSIYLEYDSQNTTTISNEFIVSAKNIPIDSIDLKNSIDYDISMGFNSYYNLYNWQLNLDISQSAYQYGNKYYTRVSWKTDSGNNIELPNLVYSAPDSWKEQGYLPSTAQKYVNFLAFDVTKVYYYNSQRVGTIYDLLDKTFNDAAQEKWKWLTIKDLITSTPVNTYATVVNIGSTDDIFDKDDLDIQTIQFKFNEVLDENYKLFMVYSIYEDIYNVSEAVYDDGSDVKPVFVRLDYSLPAVHFFDESCVSPTGVGNSISLDTSTREFYFYDKVFFNALAYDPTFGDLYTEDTFDFKENKLNDEFRDSFKMMTTDVGSQSFVSDTYYASCFTGESKDYFNFSTFNGALTTDIEGYFLKISLKEAYSVLDDSENTNTYSLTQTRTVNFVADAWWDDEKWNAFNSASDKSGYSGYFSYVYSVSNDYTINFVGENLKIGR